MSREDIFLEAVSRGDAAERAAYVAAACGGDAALREEVERLLRAHDATGSFLDGPLFDAPPPGRHPDGVGEPVGPYRLLEAVGEGGMGTVYRAEQSHPVRREVAVKVVRAGLASDEALARFEAERQALALMDHPNIARIFDAGAIERPGEAARPYFVMELVRGVPITRYCDEHGLTLRQRLEILLPVVLAVQHAHQKGVIHRDLKPSNVLVAEHDGRPVAKVIDFGIAKAAGVRLTDRTVSTEVGQVVGTLEYMSPEQARLDAVDADTRSDVYSLGVLLYELLTGTTPLARERLRAAPLLEALRLVREEEPPRPSARLAAAAATAAVAERRGLSPSRLRALAREDLDWVVMRCLEKDRARRYETANSLATDLRRYLRHEPVLARPPSVRYRLRKLVRRHPTATGFAGAAALLLVGGVAVAFWAQRDDARRAAERREVEVERTLRLAKLESDVGGALSEAGSLGDQAAARVDDLPRWESASSSALSALRRAEALFAQGGGALTPALLERLRGTKERLEADERDRRFVTEFDRLRAEASRSDPETSRFGRGKVLATGLVEAFHSYGIEHGSTPPATVVAAVAARPPRVREHLLTALYACFDDLSAAEQETRREWHQRIVDALDQDSGRRAVLRALTSRDREALETAVAGLPIEGQPPALLIRMAESLPKQEFGATRRAFLRKIQAAYPSDFWANEQLAWNLFDSKPADLPGAIRYYTAALAVRPRSAGVWVNLGVALLFLGDFPASLDAFDRAVAIEPAYTMALSDRGDVLVRMRRMKDAEAAYRAALASNPRSPVALRKLGVFLERHGGDPVEALDLLRKAVAVDPGRKDTWGEISTVCTRLRDLAGALEADRAVLGIDPGDAMAHNNYGVDLGRKGDFAAAAAELRRALEIDPGLAMAHANLGFAQRELYDRPGAVASLRSALALDAKYTRATVELARLLRRDGRLAEGIALLEAAKSRTPEADPYRSDVDEELENQRRLAALEPRLAAVVSGKESPASAQEGLDFAELAEVHGHFRAGARLYGEVIAEASEVAEDVEGAGLRALAAGVAAQAAAGAGTDAPATEAERSTWRRKAIGWLRADLERWSEITRGGDAGKRAAARTTFDRWRRRPELAAIRDAEAISGLPEAERAEIRRLWADVDAAAASSSGDGAPGR